MKKLILSIAAVVISTSMFANKDVEASLCSKTNSISKSELLNCREITLNNAKYKIWSYKLGYEHKHDNTKDYFEFTGVSEKIEDGFMARLKNYTPDVLYLEQVIVVNEKNEKFTLDPIKIYITE